MGDRSCRSRAVALGVAAVVIDGAVRDSSRPSANWASRCSPRALNPNGPTKLVLRPDQPSRSRAASTAHPGDLVVGDCDGVTVIEREKRRAAAAAGREEGGRRNATHRRPSGNGEARGQAWLDGALRAAGVINEGETL